MINFQQLTIDRFVRELKKAYRHVYGSLEERYASVLSWAGRLALENIANGDALYHNVEHTIMVTLAGQAILKGKQLSEGGIAPRDWLHFMIAALCHDIGYLRDICRQDREGVCASGINDELVEVSAEGTDVALTPYHVDRGKLFVRERFGGSLLVDVEPGIIADYIEMTRFPIPADEHHKDTRGLGGLLRAADFIGQLGDPNYLRKIPALYYEFAEIGLLEHRGYRSPGEMRRRFGQFYWSVVRPYVEDALGYLRITHEGKQWIASLHANVFDVEHGGGS
jgi:hypothetical protein